MLLYESSDHPQKSSTDSDHLIDDEFNCETKLFADSHIRNVIRSDDIVDKRILKTYRFQRFKDCGERDRTQDFILQEHGSTKTHGKASLAPVNHFLNAFSFSEDQKLSGSVYNPK